MVDACSVEGDIVFPRTAGKPPGGVRLKLTGGNLGPGRDAEFDFDATVRDPDPGAPVGEIATRGALTATLNGQSAIERMDIRLDAAARGPLVPAAARLKVDVALKRIPGGEVYTIALNSIEAGVASRLLTLDGEYAAGASVLSGSWEIRADHRQVAPFPSDLPCLNSPSRETAGSRRAFRRGTSSLRGGWPAAPAGWRSLIRGCANSTGSGRRRRSTCGTSAAGCGSRTWLQPSPPAGRCCPCRRRRPSPWIWARAPSTPSGGQRELVRIGLEGVPMSWIRPFLPALGLSGDEITGEVVAAVHGADRVWLRTVLPLSRARARGPAGRRGSSFPPAT